MLNNESLVNGCHTMVGYLSAVIDDPFNCEVRIVVHSDDPGYYVPKIRGMQTAMICVPYGTLGLNRLMSSVVGRDQRVSFVGIVKVNLDGFLVFIPEAVVLLDNDETVYSTISVEELRTVRMIEREVPHRPKCRSEE